MPTVSVNGIAIAYESFGSTADPPVLLVAGLGAQMIGWDEEFCQRLAGRGHRVVRFDNRDAGLSTRFAGGPPPQPAAALSGDHSSASYTLADMADDTAGLVAALDLGTAHVVGISMGGMIAQTLAIRHPARVRSLTSIMSTTGDPSVGEMQPAGMRALTLPPARSREEVADRAVEGWELIGSKGFPGTEEERRRLRERARQAWDRGIDPLAVGRQLVAILVSGDRTPALGAVGVPTLVVHGSADPLIGVSGGHATAKAVPGAELDVIEGMAHDLPLAVWDRVIDRIAGVVRRGEEP